eukprot:11195130-Lingulodinium_polyedra.AAC.1
MPLNPGAAAPLLQLAAQRANAAKYRAQRLKLRQASPLQQNAGVADCNGANPVEEDSVNARAALG